MRYIVLQVSHRGPGPRGSSNQAKSPRHSSANLCRRHDKSVQVKTTPYELSLQTVLIFPKDANSDAGQRGYTGCELLLLVQVVNTSANTNSSIKLNVSDLIGYLTLLGSPTRMRVLAWWWGWGCASWEPLLKSQTAPCRHDSVFRQPRKIMMMTKRMATWVVVRVMIKVYVNDQPGDPSSSTDQVILLMSGVKHNKTIRMTRMLMDVCLSLIVVVAVIFVIGER